MLRSLAAAARWPAAAAARRRLLHLGRGAGGGEEVESVAYRMSMLRAPPIVRKKAIPSSNSCSLIGRLRAPVRLSKSSSEENPRAYTFLSVAPSCSSSSGSSDFTVTLELDGNLANVCLKHLKHNDLVYVSGFLNSYGKIRETGERYIYYKIHVMELNYVFDHNKKPRNDEDSADPALTPSASTEILEESKYRERLRLWQVFFASPYEWWDNRQHKPYINCPDFKHKDTREKLWLHPDDPPWVRKQLELIDSKKPRNDEDSADPALTPSASTEILEENKYRERLRLWQVFFASPYEWWDNRQHKPYINCPDFKHKDTREKLWLHPDDPPWVRKQLELIDQQTAEIGHRDGRGRLTNPRWNAQDFDYSDEWHDDEEERCQANG